MADIYGHRWTSQYGDTDERNTWARALADLSADQLAVGLRRCVEIGADRAQTQREDWPPTAGEFRGYCLGDRRPRYIGSPYRQLEKPALTVEERAKIRQELFAAVGRKA